MAVSRAKLEPLTLIAEGAFGKVYRTDYRRASDPVSLAYKEFTVEDAERVAAADSAEAAVAFRNDLDPDERAQLDAYYAWPREPVEEPPGTVCGFLMPLLDEAFFCERIDEETDQLTSKPRDISWLIARKQTLLAAQVNLGGISHEERLFLMAKLAYAIGWLHKRRWVYGDLSFKNVVFALEPPRIMLIDCDGAADLDNADRKQFSTPFWVPPECSAGVAGQPPKPQDSSTDAYKISLAILRCLTPGPGASNTTSPARFRGALDQEGVGLITRALEEKGQDRPTVKELYAYLRRVTLPLVVMPSVVHAKLATHFRLRDQPFRIDWELTEADDITVLAAGGFRDDIKYADNRDGYVLRPRESGPVSIVVRNKYGSTRLELGEVTVYDLPPFHVDLNDLPDPQVPDIEAFSVEPLATALTARDGAELTFPAAPEIRTPDVPGLVAAVAPDSLISLPWPRVDDALIDVSVAMKDLILSVADKRAAALRENFTGVGDG
jgi:hypothetical protein